MVATSGFLTKSSLGGKGGTCEHRRRRLRCCLASGKTEPAFEIILII
jgi:hypothetical protein